MISLEGLTLLTGRHGEARCILRTFAQHVRDGLIPNLFPEGETEGLYHTADATLWFFHALDRYEQRDGRRRDARGCCCRSCATSCERHLAGTRFGIGVDPADGLLRQGAEGYQLTWMDAKVGDWVVTPRRGKAVEINALWYNALRLLARWLRARRARRRRGGVDMRAEVVRAHADRAARDRFNRRFWNEAGGCLYDVVDGEGGGDDASIPPQPAARDLAAAPGARAARAGAGGHATSCASGWLTPFGLRSLAPGHPDYKPRYDGDLRARDAAYHQGTVWGWLIGPFVDAWLKTFPTIAPARAACSTGSNRISSRRASARSARSSTPSRPSRRAAASPRPGASPRRCARFA